MLVGTKNNWFRGPETKKDSSKLSIRNDNLDNQPMAGTHPLTYAYRHTHASAFIEKSCKVDNDDGY